MLPNEQRELREIFPQKALYIKLGSGGEWENECINEGKLKLGYHSYPHELCMDDKWDLAKEEAYKPNHISGAATNHTRQVKEFYCADENTLWLTFYGDFMWWCFADKTIKLCDDDTKERKVIGKWNNTDINGKELKISRISGKISATRGFQGTICNISELNRLINTINGNVPAEIKEVQEASDNLISKIIPLIRDLHPKDFEVFIDLIFRQSGWQRTSVLGETEKDLDLQLYSPITKEYLAVQVKSRLSDSLVKDYAKVFEKYPTFHRLYLVGHSSFGDFSEVYNLSESDNRNIIIWREKELSELAVQFGLVQWLIDKTF